MLDLKKVLKSLILCGCILSSACVSNTHLPKNSEYGRHLDVDSVLNPNELQQLGIGEDDDEFSSLLELRFSTESEDQPYRLVMITQGVALEDINGQLEWNVQLFSATDAEPNLFHSRKTTQILARAVKLKKGQSFLFVDPFENYAIPSTVDRDELGVILSLKQPNHLKIQSVAIQLWSNRDLEKEKKRKEKK